MGSRDRARLDEYLANVREVERRIVKRRRNARERNLEAPRNSKRYPRMYDEHVKLMFELQALAFQGDLTRVTTFMMGRELSAVVPADRHQRRPSPDLAPQLRHQADGQEGEGGHVQREPVRHFLQRLKDTPDGDSNLLENSLFVYGSGMSDGNVHNHLNLPVLIGGNAGGQLKGGRHFQVGQLAAERAFPPYRSSTR